MTVLLLAALLTQADPGTTVLFQYTVRDAATTEAIPFVEARITSDSGGSGTFGAVGDGEGRLTFSVPAGVTVVATLSALGYEPWTFTSIPIGPVESGVVWLSPQPIELEGLSAEVERVSLSLERSGFYERRRRGAGAFLGPEDLANVRAREPRDFFRRIVSVRISDSEPVFARGGSGFDGSCWPLVVLDGILVREPTHTHLSVNDLVSVNDVAAIEAYPSGTGAPAQYSGTGAACGVIMIWTKR